MSDPLLTTAETFIALSILWAFCTIAASILLADDRMGRPSRFANRLTGKFRLRHFARSRSFFVPTHAHRRGNWRA